MELDKDQDKYTAYKQRALFLGVTGRTRSALVVAAFRVDPTFAEDLPSQLVFSTRDFKGQASQMIQ